MLLRWQILAVCLVGVLVTWSPRAFSYQAASSIDYSTLTATLSGYSRTWKDPTDPDAYYDCFYWVFDDYGYSCYGIQLQVNYVYVVANVSSPSAPFYTTNMVDLTDAVAPFGFSATAAGLWTVLGQHNVISDFYTMWCPYNFCTPPVYSGTQVFNLGTTQDAAFVWTLPTLIPMDISRYTTSSLSSGEALGILVSATEILQTDDGGGDTSCSVLFLPGGDIDVFAVGDGIIRNEAELAQVMAVPGLVQVVNEIRWCGGPPTIPNATIVGCGNSTGVTVVRTSAEGVLWAHEYGHNQALGFPHNPNLGFVMHKENLPDNRRVTQSECNAYLNPLP